MKKFFSVDAWKLVEEVIKTKAANPTWVCPICEKDLNDVEDDATLLACDSCLEWFHLTCLGKKKRPKAKTWMCNNCCGKANSTSSR